MTVWSRVKDTEYKLLLLNPNYLLKYPIWAWMTSHSTLLRPPQTHSLDARRIITFSISTSSLKITINSIYHEAITCPSHSCHRQCFCLFHSKWRCTNIYAIEYASAHHGWKLEGENTSLMICNRKKWNALDRILFLFRQLKRCCLFTQCFQSLYILFCEYIIKRWTQPPKPMHST